MGEKGANQLLWRLQTSPSDWCGWRKPVLCSKVATRAHRANGISGHTSKGANCPRGAAYWALLLLRLLASASGGLSCGRSSRCPRLPLSPSPEESSQNTKQLSKATYPPTLYRRNSGLFLELFTPPKTMRMVSIGFARRREGAFGSQLLAEALIRSVYQRGELPRFSVLCVAATPRWGSSVLEQHARALRGSFKQKED
jgi:hypothetical protein